MDNKATTIDFRKLFYYRLSLAQATNIKTYNVYKTQLLP